MRIVIIIIAALLSYSAVSLGVTALVYNLIFSRYDVAAEIPPQLQTMVQNREAHPFQSGDNQLAGYLYRSTSNPLDALVVIAPGYHAGAEDYLWQIKELNDRGWSVFIFDPTGTCNSEGKNAVGFSQEILDLNAAIMYIENSAGFGYNNLMLIGHSRGGYAACSILGSQHQIDGVVSISGIDSAMDAIMGYARQYAGILAYANYGFLWLYQALLFGADTVGIQAHEQLSESDVPALVIHGAMDAQVPLDLHSILSHQEEVKGENTQFLVWSEQQQDGHTSLLFDADGTANNELMDTIHSFLLSCM